MTNKLPPATTLKRIYDAGFSIKKIARIYNVSHQAVSQKLRTGGFAIDKSEQYNRSQRAEAMMPAIKRYREIGYSYERIEALTGIPASTVKRVCKREGIKRGKRKTRLTVEEVFRLKSLRKMGVSYKDIGVQMGYDAMTIWRADKEFE